MSALKSDCAFLMLSSGDFALVDESDMIVLEGFSWQFSGKSYVSAWIAPKRTYLHRFLMNPSDSQEVDHINRNRTDNRRCNLRLCTGNQNRANVPKPSFIKKRSATRYSKFKGVAKKHRRWTARAVLDGKKIWLGSFKTEMEAAAAYDAFSKKTYGEFAVLNLPQA